MARVSLVIGLLDGLGGGTEQHLLSLCHGLPARGLEVEVVAVFDHEFLRSRPLPCEVSALCRGTRGLWRWQAASRLAAAWRARPVDAALAFFDNAQFTVTDVAARTGLRAVLSARRNMGTERRGMAGWWLRRSDRGVKRFVCNSEAVRDAVVAGEGIARERTVVLYNGIETVRVAAEPWRQPHGVPAEAPVVACVSGLRPIKGVDVFLNAFSRVLSMSPDAHALVVGDGTERRGLERLAASLGIGARVHFAGWRDDSRPLLSGSRVGVLASHSEGFSNAVLEYMAAGLPVVATRVGGNAEAVRDGVDGVLVPAGDPAALGEAVGGLLRDPARAAAMGASARARVVAEFDRGVMLDRMAGILRTEIAECAR